MLSKLFTFSLFGIEANRVEVEVDISAGALPKTILVGLAEAAARESTYRVERALVNSGYAKPTDRIVINLSPADLPKEAASFDLPIALGLLGASDQLHSDKFNDYASVGELALDGKLRPVKGILSMTLEAKKQGLQGILVPNLNAQEAAVVDGIDIISVGNIAEAVGFFTDELPLHPVKFNWSEARTELGTYELDYSDVKGQELAKRALTVAAAGNHHILMLGSPGTGKTLLAQRLSTILPELSIKESLETTQIYSAVGRLSAQQSLMMIRPFRSPHHTISEPGLVGGGTTPSPGEISLAHNGVLFLDELPEFNRKTLEVLRQPLEENCVTISRVLGSATFPANVMLVAAMNPCPCGYQGDPKHRCQCSPNQVERYRSKISGPLLDRIDLHIDVPPVSFRELSTLEDGTNSSQMKEEVLIARELQKSRFASEGNQLNGKMPPPQIRKFCKLTSGAEFLLKSAMETMGLSARAHDKILRISRTIADLDQSLNITDIHLSEAINYRTLDRTYIT